MYSRDNALGTDVLMRLSSVKRCTQEVTYSVPVYSRGGVLCAEAPHVHRVEVVGHTLVEAHVHRSGRVNLHFGFKFALSDLPLVHLVQREFSVTSPVRTVTLLHSFVTVTASGVNTFQVRWAFASLPQINVHFSFH